MDRLGSATARLAHWPVEPRLTVMPAASGILCWRCGGRCHMNLSMRSPARRETSARPFLDTLSRAAALTGAPVPRIFTLGWR